MTCHHHDKEIVMTTNLGFTAEVELSVANLKFAAEIELIAAN